MSAAERMEENDNVYPLFDTPTLGSVSLEPGSRGDEVLRLQQNLTALGFVGLAQNGIYDVTLSDAVKAIQREMKRPDDGKLDPFLSDVVTRAIEKTSDYLEAQAVSKAAIAFNNRNGPAQPSLPVTQVQVPVETAFWKTGKFWLMLGGGALALWATAKALDGAPRPLLPGAGFAPTMAGVDDPEDFFGEDEAAAPKKKRRRKALAKKGAKRSSRAVSDIIDEIGDDAHALPPSAVEIVEAGGEDAIDVTPEIAEVAGAPDVAAPPAKPKRKRKSRKAKTLPSTPSVTEDGAGDVE